MPWETRQRGGRYYVRVRRGEGRLIREYIGAGERGEAAAREDAYTRRKRAVERAGQRAAHQQRQDYIAALTRDLDLFCLLTDGLAARALIGAGYHQRSRGHWRKARQPRATPAARRSTIMPDASSDTPEQSDAAERPETAPEETSPAVTTWSADDIQRLISRAQFGDAAALDELHAAMRAQPEVEAALSDFAYLTLLRVARTTIDMDDLFLMDVFQRQLDRLRGELAPTARTPLERVLVERVVVAWAGVQLAEHAASHRLESERALRRLNAAHQRFVTASAALARVTRLLTPVVAQINIATAGAQQLNVAAPPPPTPPPPGEFDG